jgi:hypothetical protein
MSARRITILDPRAEPLASHPSPAAADTADATACAEPAARTTAVGSLAGRTVGLRLDRSWRSYETVLDVWEPALRAGGASVARVVVDARVAGAGERMRDDLHEWRRLVDCAVVGLGN